jgi:arsenate reductase
MLFPIIKAKGVYFMKILFIQYPKCSTCKKAKKWLDEHYIPYQDRHIIEDNPTFEELQEWIDMSGLPLKRFFNTSGMKYRELQLKDRLPKMNEEEQINLLSNDGMLVKRPLVIGEDFVLVGFKEKEWERLQ